MPNGPSDSLTRWVAGVAGALVVVALTGVWTNYASMVTAVGDMKTTNSELRGAIDRLGDRIGTFGEVTNANMRRKNRWIC